MGGVYSPVGIDIIKPVGVEGPVGAGEDEADATRSGVLIRDLDRVRDLRVRDMSTGNVSGRVDHMPCKTTGVNFALERREEIRRTVGVEGDGSAGLSTLDPVLSEVGFRLRNEIVGRRRTTPPS